jgi:nucleoside-diphosphate-sugar epimerase
VAVENLVSAIRFVIASPDAVGETFVVADPEALTLAEIIAVMREGMQHSSRLIGVPPEWIRLFLKAAGRHELWDRIGGTLIVKPTKLMSAGWRPAVEARVALAALVRADNLLRST